ncbi:hypothetical protein CN941_21205 [Bacillus cereus]|nr:hypothetical protein CN527_21640 [Bacillus cereus]PFA26033.1 hypothetical protein CN390_28655 [Bacillus cereus]PFE64263.1 hypothetical protein CN316_23450 [Bacillus cereus]PGL33890.1 hypothetical protein CN930_20470 [Bacillus cereus]PGM38158.1 hypothetical protein CN941_21205 [Bacillus cereus]
MTKIRVTFNMSSGISRATILEAKDYEDAQQIIKNKFFDHEHNNYVLYVDADHPKGNLFEVIENHVVCIDYEKDE